MASQSEALQGQNSFEINHSDENKMIF